MIIYGLSIADVHASVNRVSRETYNGNIIFKRAPEKSGRGVKFTLTVRSSSEPGARRAPHTWRKIAAACWHAHRDVMQEFLRLNPACKLRSALWSWNGRAEFERGLQASGEYNIGSMFQPCCAADACECER